ncbi:hypothetical protein [Microbacterium immunditiarum]|uniref:Uncharacterized protein n=1 Tax=Microbacterium immunditiarum TaxID=337480 RepID=A0A7Y9KJS3_9MICO|nr:hypothetical protein [Microbacterium immunditiarum]NYE20080.1 hypothetical protein [Microbacterium immunditiarum]
MTASSLSPERMDELAALRARAYGPDADIHEDAGAVARLHELEELARRAELDEVSPPAADTPTTVDPVREQPAMAEAFPQSTVVVERNGSPAPVDDPETVGAASDSTAEPQDEPDASPDADPDADATEAAPAPEVPEPRRGVVGLWRRIPRWAIAVVGVIAGAAAGVGLAAAAAAQPEARLAIDPTREASGAVFLPSGALVYYGLEQSDLRMHEMYGDLQVVTGTNEFGHECLFAAVGERWLNGGCAPAELGAVFDINDDYGLQEIADPDLPEGSTIRLVLDGDLVEVWIHEGDGPTRVFER